MGKKEKRVDTSPTSTSKGKDAAVTEPERKGKGHRQKGAGTIVVSKGEVTVGGIVMKEWQRTPVQLVQEYCQRQKRPRPQFYNERAPPGKFNVKVVLPDEKNKEKNLVYSGVDCFDDSILAKNCSCLLALHALQPSLPLHQKLPEPYSSMWIKLTGTKEAVMVAKEEIPQYICSVCKKSFEKELGLSIHMKKEHKTKVLVSEEGSETLQESPSTTPTSPNNSEPRRIADYRENEELKGIVLEKKGRFDSLYEKKKEEEEKRINRIRAQKKKELNELLHKPPAVLLSEENQAFILSLLDKYEEKGGEVSIKEKEHITEDLLRLGFKRKAIEESLRYNDSKESCIEWICLYTEDDELPKAFRAKGKQMDVVVKKSEKDSVASELEWYGFTAGDIRYAKKENASVEECVIGLIRLLTNDNKECEQCEQCKQREDIRNELDALRSIYGDEVQIMEKESQISVLYREIKILLLPNYGYPNGSPLVFVHSPSVSSDLALSTIYTIYMEYKETRECGVLYEIMSDIASFIEKANRNLRFVSAFHDKTSSQLLVPHSPYREQHSPSSQKMLNTTRSSTRSSTKSLVTPTSSQLFGSPSPAVQKQRESLPITSYRSAFLAMLSTHQVCMISGGTGCGKSTQIPQFILEAYRGEMSQQRINVVVCEPRRISCLGLFNRVKEEQGFEERSSIIGYQVRGDSKVSPSTLITYCTTGVLLRQLQSSTDMSNITHIIVDEIHERSLLSDFLLLLLKQILEKNTRIKIILMSATIDSKLFSDYFHTIPCLSVEGRVYPVKEVYLDEIVFDSRYTPSSMLLDKEEGTTLGGRDMEEMLTKWCDKYQDYELIVKTVHLIFNSTHPWKNGVILVFLPGAGEIKTVQQLLWNEMGDEIEVVCCHGSLSTQEQKRVFETNVLKKRIVLATNIAETSITIPNCMYVIDTGREKRVEYNNDSHVTEMKEVWVSQASAIQRKGRAGRVCSGVVYRLYTQSTFLRFESYTPPEILRTPLNSLCLQVLRMNLGDPYTVLQNCITPPSYMGVVSSMNTLNEIQAIVKKENRWELTSLGENIADLPLDCRLAKMLLYGCLLKCVDSVTIIASFLSIRTVFRAPIEKRDEMTSRKLRFAHRYSDHITLIRVYREWEICKNKREFCRDNFINYESMQTIATLQRQYMDELKSIHYIPADYRSGDASFNKYGNEENVIKAAITAGLYSNVIKIEKSRIKFHKTAEGGTFESTPQAKEYKLKVHRESGEERVFIHPSSVNFAEREYHYPFMLYTTIMNTSKLFVHDVTIIPPYPLLLFGGRIAINPQRSLIIMDNWLEMTAAGRVSVLVQRLRDHMDTVLHDKFRNERLRLDDDPVMDGICDLLISNGLLLVFCS